MTILPGCGVERCGRAPLRKDKTLTELTTELTTKQRSHEPAAAWSLALALLDTFQEDPAPIYAALGARGWTWEDYQVSIGVLGEAVSLAERFPRRQADPEAPTPEPPALLPRSLVVWTNKATAEVTAVAGAGLPADLAVVVVTRDTNKAPGAYGSPWEYDYARWEPVPLERFRSPNDPMWKGLRAALPAPQRPRLTPAEWDAKPVEYKTTIEGQPYSLMFDPGAGTSLVPVDIIEPAPEPDPTLPGAAALARQILLDFRESSLYGDYHEEDAKAGGDRPWGWEDFDAMLDALWRAADGGRPAAYRYCLSAGYSWAICCPCCRAETLDDPEQPAGRDRAAFEPLRPEDLDATTLLTDPRCAQCEARWDGERWVGGEHEQGGVRP